jgi:hypothetical protein
MKSQDTDKAVALICPVSTTDPLSSFCGVKIESYKIMAVPLWPLWPPGDMREPRGSALIRVPIHFPHGTLVTMTFFTPMTYGDAFV